MTWAEVVVSTVVHVHEWSTDQLLFAIQTTDPLLLSYFSYGLTVGVLIVTTLHLFPGKPWGIDYHRESVGNSQAQHDLNHASELMLDTGGWVGDEIPQDKLEEVRKRLGLSQDQMKQAIECARHEGSSGRSQSLALPNRFNHRMLDPYIYLIGTCMLIYFINRDYNNVVSWWFAYWFPKEARTLGMFVPEPIGSK